MSGKVPPAGQHGGDAHLIARRLGIDESDLLDLSASLNPVGPDVPKLAADHLEALVPYPDAGPATELLAAALDVGSERLVLTNGGSEAIALVAYLVGAGTIIEPEFSLYRRHLPVVDDDSPRWKSNPSNPLGELVDPSAWPDVGVWDEAFYPLATGRWHSGVRGVFQLGSLTKLWSCAGLRLGYVICPSGAEADALRAAQPRWSVNGLALALVEPLLAQTDLVRWRDEITALRSSMAWDLTAAGIHASEASANWVLIRLAGGNRSAAAIREQMIAHRIVVRDCSSFGLDDTIRVAVPKPEDLDRVVSALAAVLGEGSPGVQGSPGEQG